MRKITQEEFDERVVVTARRIAMSLYRRKDIGSPNFALCLQDAKNIESCVLGYLGEKLVDKDNED